MHAPLWRRAIGALVRALTHDAARDRAKAERADTARAILAAAHPDQRPLVLLVRETLFHQGTPRQNALMVLHHLREGRSHGWDEASYDVEGERVTVQLLDERIEVDRAELIDLLERIVAVSPAR
jgi:hypothetical protein